ncbi:hypothetical protein [Streptomyces sp. RKAG293]|uniref:hypothetical protein n=1 Tax=Streptomyces sp. RKAG293 TaxID=2893403 RepID=UPI00203416C0|nr:hypothetical protein [Streptomyces sp. RKAG293]MCM2418614.1 hypothetical protein [Streptomyces sp. RKAG293]
MNSTVVDLRRWLTGLSDEELRGLLVRQQLFRELACSQSRGRSEGPQVSRRDIRSARAWLPKSLPRNLLGIAEFGLGDAAARLVRELGHPDEAVGDPTLEQLEAMLAALEPIEARLALFGMVLGDVPVSPMARMHEQSLIRASARHPSEPRPEPVREGKRDGQEAAVTLLAGDGAETAGMAGTHALSGAAERLRAGAVVAAGQLREAADAVCEGRLPDDIDGLTDALASWCAERAVLGSQIGSHGHAWPETADFTALGNLLALIGEEHARAVEREARRQAAACEERVAKLTTQAANYRNLLAGSDDPVDAELITGLLTRALEKLQELGAPVSEADMESTPLQGGGEAAPQEQLADRRNYADLSPDLPLDFVPAAAVVVLSVQPEPLQPAEILVAMAPESADQPNFQEQDGALPWSEESPSPIVELIAAARLDEAYWLTAASAEPRTRADALAFASAAFGCVTETDASAVLMAHNRVPEKYADDREAHLIALAAALCAGLNAGWPSALVTGYTPIAGLPECWQQLVTALASAVRQCRKLEAGAGRITTEPGTGQTRGEIGSRAQQLMKELPRRTVKYQRATRALQRMAAKNGVLGHTLVLIHRWADGEESAEALEAEAAQYRRPQADSRMIEEADRAGRAPKHAKEEIHSGARRQLQVAVASVAELLDMALSVALAAARQNTVEEADSDLAPVIHAVLDVEVPPGPAGAMLGLLRDWLRGDMPAAAVSLRRTAEDDEVQDESADEVWGIAPDADCLLALPEVARNTDGTPIPGPDTVAHIASLLRPVDPAGALSSYLCRGDLHLAEQLIGAMVAGRVPSAGGWNPLQVDSARRDLEESTQRWGEQLNTALSAVGSQLAQVRTLNLLNPYEEREFTGFVQELAGTGQDGRYRAALMRIADLSAQLSDMIKKFADKMRDDLATLKVEAADHERICSLLNDGDTVTAEEFLSFARRGEPLPERPAETGEELREFLAVVGHPQAPKPANQGVSARWWAERYAAGASLTPGAEQGLAAWDALCDATRRSMEWQRHIPDVLRLIGLECGHLGPRNSERLTRGVQRITVRATSSEARPGYIAALGSRATEYTVLLISEEQRAEGGPLAHLDDADLGSNIVLYLHPLGARGRRRLAETSRGRTQQALVVDPASVGWIAARAPRSFRSLQRITLPWAGYNPYTPFVAGLVPPEVFYGRDEQMAQVMDQQGGLFLYGGRQLGKSSLLRQAAEVFPRRNADHVAIYLDLLKAEIGQAEPPERIWGVLVEALKR